MTFQGPGFLLEEVDEIDDFDGVDGIAGTVSWAPAGTAPTLGEGWTEIGYTTDGIRFAADPIEPLPKEWRHETPARISRDMIVAAMGEGYADVARDAWPPKPDPLADLLRMPVIESPWVPPGQVLIGAHGLGARTWPLDEHRGGHIDLELKAETVRPWWSEGMWTYLAAERIALSIPRTYGVTVTSSVPTIGHPPRKGRGLTGRRYRAARRAYARKRRAWVRAGSPTYPTAIHLPHVLVNIA